MNDIILKIILAGLIFSMLLSGFNQSLSISGGSINADEEALPCVKPDYTYSDTTFSDEYIMFGDRDDLLLDDTYFLGDDLNSDATEPEFISGELIVKLKQEVNVEFITIDDGIAKIDVFSVDQLNDKYEVTSVEKIFQKNIRDVEDTSDLSNVYRFIIPQDIDVFTVVKEYNEDPNVEYAEPNYIFHTCGSPNDPYFTDQWSLDQSNDCDIDAPEAWDIETGNSDVVIAVIDSGVDYNHPDLADNIWINENEIPDNDIDDDGNGIVDDYLGYDFCYDDINPLDDFGHGTHCAGIIGAVGNNNNGITGVCWDCSIMAIKGFNCEGGGSSDDLAEAIIYAVDNGADVISMSWRGPNSDLIRDAINQAYSNGAVLVAAAGNNNWNSVSYPAAYENVIAVAATDMNDVKASFSNYGHSIDVSAPGVSIYSTMPTYYVTMNEWGFQQDYDCCSGTSMACPHVAGVIGLVLSDDVYSQLTNDEIGRRVIATADDIYNMNPNHRAFLGSGRINAYNALSEESQPHLRYLSHEISNRGFSVNETSELWFRMKNIWIPGTNVTIILHTESTYVNITNDNIYFEDVLTDEIVDNENNPFIISFESEYPDEEDIFFTLTINSNDDCEQSIELVFPVWSWIKWNPTEGPILDLVSTIAIDPFDNKTIYAGTGTFAIFMGVPSVMPAGICKSTDSGESWKLKDYRLDDCCINSIAVDPKEPGIVYAGTRNGLYKSINGGQQWTKLTKGLPGDDPFEESCNVLSVVIDPYDSRILYAGVIKGIYKSEDAGESWTPVNHGLPTDARVSCLAINTDPVSTHEYASSIIYAGTYQYGIFKSINNGQTWESINNGLPEGCYIVCLAISPSNPFILYAGVSLYQTMNGLYKSEDGGESWVKKSEGLPQNAEIECIAVDPFDSDMVLVGTGKGRDGGAFCTTTGFGAFKTTDGGERWVNISHGLPEGGCVASLVIDPKNPNIVYAGTQVGVYKGVYTTAKDNFVWNAMHNGWPQDSIVYALAADPDEKGPVYAGTSPSAVFKKTRDQNNWIRMNKGLPTLTEVDTMVIDKSDPRKLYIGTFIGGVYNSSDYGESWTPMNEGIPETDRWIISLAINPKDGLPIYASSLFSFPPTIYRYQKDGIPNNDPLQIGSTYSWQTANNGLPHNRGFISCFAVDPSTPSTVYVGLSGMDTRGGIFKSTNSGDYWMESDNGMPYPFGLYVRSIIIDPLSTNTIYAGTNYGVYWSVDHGESWAPLNTGIENVDIIALELESYPFKKILYAGTYRDGIFKKTMSIEDFSNEPWEPMNDGLTSYRIRSLLLHKENGRNRLYVGTFGEGVFCYDLPIKSLNKPPVR